MRTTVEIPDELFRQAKARAALDGVPLKDMIAESLRRLLVDPRPAVPTAAPRRTQFPLIPADPGRPPLTRDTVRAAIERMDDEIDLHHAGPARH